MKQIVIERFLQIPPEVHILVKALKISVRGPRGSLNREFRHLYSDVYEDTVKGHEALKVNAYFAKKDHLAVIQTLRSHIANMITGVTDGFTCKMRAVYAHFPIDIKPKGDNLEITNFLGEKRIRIVKMIDISKQQTY
jgi:large subunit ribosomal protein L9e